MNHNDFQKQLEQSHLDSQKPYWEEIYRQAFPNYEQSALCQANGQNQASGLDRAIFTTDKTIIKVDEKVRKRNALTGKVYDDIALEFISDDVLNTPGWVCKKLTADFIAYAIEPLGICYLLPIEPLQDAWRRLSQAWMNDPKHKKIKAINKRGYTYYTHSLALPPSVLATANIGMRVFTFTPYGESQLATNTTIPIKKVKQKKAEAQGVLFESQPNCEGLGL